LAKPAEKGGAGSILPGCKVERAGRSNRILSLMSVGWMPLKLRLKCQLPTIVQVGGCVYQLQMRFLPSTETWHVAVRHLGDGFVAFLTGGRVSPHDLEDALSDGIELFPDPVANRIVAELVHQDCAEYIAAA
jgi:hypothetical protein